MDTSSSVEPEITAGIDIFSGRPNPSWPLSRGSLDELREVWNTLDAIEAPLSIAAPPTILGYRGCFVLAGEERWLASGEVVTLQRPHGSESRRDKRREFERLILSSAPADFPFAAFIDLSG